jgi:hypothetical protein
MKRELERSPHASPKLDAINALEPLIASILSEQRKPTQEERFKIAKTLYETSAADPSYPGSLWPPPPVPHPLLILRG